MFTDPAPYGYGMFSVTNNAKQPERIFELIDFLASEEGFILNGWGIEGEDYYINEDGERDITDTYLALHLAEDPAEKKARGIGAFSAAFFSPAANEFGYATNSYAPTLQDMVTSERKLEFLNETGYKTGTDVWFGENSRYDGIKDYDMLFVAYESLAAEHPLYDTYQEILEYSVGQMAKLIMAPDDASFDALYEETVNTRKAMGIDDVVDAINAQVAEAKEKLGLE